MIVSLRPAVAVDEPFLRRVYGSTRADELEFTDWDDATKTAFIEQQFRAQHDYYRANYTGASYDVILVDGESAGRLYVARWDDEIRVMDIALLPELRGQGTGGRLMHDLLAEAAEAGKAVTIHVEPQNPALALYRRLGFQTVEERGVYLFLRWEPAAVR